MKYKRLNIYCDGGARGNPGPAAVGGVIKTADGKAVSTFAEVIGRATNNEAEYQAVILALKKLVEQGIEAETIIFNLDSRLVANQLAGRYKVKKYHLQNLLYTVKHWEREVKSKIHYVSIPREQNAEADALLNRALDAQTG